MIIIIAPTIIEVSYHPLNNGWFVMPVNKNSTPVDIRLLDNAVFRNPVTQTVLR